MQSTAHVLYLVFGAKIQSTFHKLNVHAGMSINKACCHIQAHVHSGSSSLATVDSEIISYHY